MPPRHDAILSPVAQARNLDKPVGIFCLPRLKAAPVAEYLDNGGAVFSARPPTTVTGQAPDDLADEVGVGSTCDEDEFVGDLWEKHGWRELLGLPRRMGQNIAYLLMKDHRAADYASLNATFVAGSTGC